MKGKTERMCCLWFSSLFRRLLWANYAAAKRRTMAANQSIHQPPHPHPHPHPASPLGANGMQISCCRRRDQSELWLWVADRQEEEGESIDHQSMAERWPARMLMTC